MKNFPFISQRGVRVVGCALLFCAFVFGYFSLMIGEQLSAFFYPLHISPTTWGVCAVAFALPLSLSLGLRYAHRYSSLRLLAGLTGLFFLIGLLTPTDELHLLELRTERLAGQKRWDEALEVGRKSSLTSDNLTALRATILEQRGFNDLPLYFFNYPLPLNTSSLLLDSYWLFSCRLSVPKSPHSTLMAFLLDRKLHQFAAHLRQTATPHDSLPPIYRQALLLHKRLTTTPLIHFHDEATEAYYQEFIAYRDQCRSLPLLKKHPSQRAEANLMQPLYGNTYWWYYYYNRPLPN